MTEGKISKSLTLFAFPIFLGNLFQQLYSVVDSLVVGNVLGKEALAAVSSTASLIFLIIGFINGIFLGASVLISKYYGQKDKEKLSLIVHTSVAFSFFAGILVTIFGIIFTPSILKLMGTPADVFADAVIYLKIYFAGSVAVVMYNAFMGIFQAIGNSKQPLYYLIIAAIINVILDILFVAVLDFGIGGAAVATIISQFVSAFLGFIKLIKIKEDYKITLNKIKLDPTMLRDLIALGLPTGVQNSVISFANVIVQASINQFGSITMAGSGIYTKLEGFAFLPIGSFSMALTTFISQNLGAHKYERAKQGARFGIVTSMILAQIIGIFIWVFAPQLISLFNSNHAVIEQGVLRARTLSLFYFLIAFSHSVSGILSGAGLTKIPMFVMLINWCLIRITYITIAIRFIPDIKIIYWAYPLTWLLSTISFALYYKKSKWYIKPIN